MSIGNKRKNGNYHIIKRKLNLCDFSFEGAAGLFERIFIGWTKDLVDSSLCKSPNYVDIVGFLNNVCVRITFVYGP